MKRVLIAYFSLTGKTEIMTQYVVKKESLVETTDGMRACQAYGRAFGEKLGN